MSCVAAWDGARRKGFVAPAPFAVLAARFPGYALTCVIGAFVPLALLAISVGSGRAEVRAPDA